MAYTRRRRLFSFAGAAILAGFAPMAAPGNAPDLSSAVKEPSTVADPSATISLGEGILTVDGLSDEPEDLAQVKIDLVVLEQDLHRSLENGRLSDSRDALAKLLERARGGTEIGGTLLRTCVLAADFYRRMGDFKRAAAYLDIGDEILREVNDFKIDDTVEARASRGSLDLARLRDAGRENGYEDEQRRLVSDLRAVLKDLMSVHARDLSLSFTARSRIVLLLADADIGGPIPELGSRLIGEVADLNMPSPLFGRLAAVEAEAGALKADAIRAQILLARGRLELQEGQGAKGLATLRDALRLADASYGARDLRLLDFINSYVVAFYSAEHRDEDADHADAPTKVDPAISKLLARVPTILEASISDYFRGSTFQEKSSFLTSLPVETSIGLFSLLSSASEGDKIYMSSTVRGRLHDAMRREMAKFRTLRALNDPLAVRVVDKVTAAAAAIYRDDRGVPSAGMRNMWKDSDAATHAWREISRRTDYRKSSGERSIADYQRALAPNEVVLQFDRVELPASGFDEMSVVAFSATKVSQRQTIRGWRRVEGYANALPRQLKDGVNASDAQETDAAEDDDSGWEDDATVFAMTFSLPVQKIIEEVAPAADHVYISPTRSLWNLPFSALFGSKNFIDEYSFALLFSLDDLLVDDAVDLGTGGPLLIGKIKPGLFDIEVPHVRPILPGESLSGAALQEHFRVTRLEMHPPPAHLRAEPILSDYTDSLAGLYRQNGLNPRVISGDAVSDADLRNGISASLVNISAHGFETYMVARDGFRFGSDSVVHALEIADAENSPYNEFSIALSRANARHRLVPSAKITETSDGILTASEAMLSDMRGVRLLVLTSCDSATGNFVSNQALVGMAPAFDLAGAKAILATVSPVNAGVTAIIMRDFHRHLLAGTTPARALWLSIKTLRASTEDGHSLDRPGYWAPFVVFGKQRPIWAPRRAAANAPK